MNDILGRELRDGDLCIGMAIGRNSNGMKIGVFQGSSVASLANSEKHVNKSCTSNTYLIENPTERELEIKRKIEVLLQEEKDERERKAAIKTIPLSKLEVGGIYKTSQGMFYVYLGKRKVILEDIYRNTKDISEGQCFAYIYEINNKTDDEIKEEILSVSRYKNKHNIDVLKGGKKLVEFVRKVDLGFPLTEEKSGGDWSYYSCPYSYKLTIE